MNELIDHPAPASVHAAASGAAAPSAASRGPLPRARPAVRRRIRPAGWQGWIVPAAVLLLWQTVSMLGWVSGTLLPAPSRIVQSLVRLSLSGELFRHLGASAFRAASGCLLGGATGLLLGLFTGLGKWAEQTLDPSMQMLRTVPLMTLIPLFILWFGVGEFSKILLIALGSFFPVYFHTFLGVRAADRKLHEVTLVLQYSPWHKLTALVLPAALPNLLLGVRLAVSASWLILAIAEMMGASSGIGYMIQDARVFSNTDIVFVGLIVFMAAGKLSDVGVRALERRWLKWSTAYKG
ncbi:ABC transporter permease [Paenibacillus glufosinatiresistens]|uniref:ABC transporter permease n=1 Tax=Paenibacillus glufosinatiresistens TaxID=3070657 RepID=UPI00286DDCCD|nr:ABC transporter permease [Paenibacillus sp. YX.27]